ncbi:MAG: nitroreductase [Parvularcula sp.]|jgi:nitroreductase|nr:nitroreductase [Parvularcula sp.]
MTSLPPAPQLGDEMPLPRRSDDMLERLALRRSHTAAQMSEPGPSQDETAQLLRIAARVPDHRRVHPFRFVTFEGKSRSAFGEVLAEAYLAENPDAPAEAVALERDRFLRAPLVIAVISSPDLSHKTPEWEQILTAGAAAQTLLIAAGAMGYGAQWLTEWYSYDEKVQRALDLEGHERIAGFLYIGTPTEASKERARMNADTLTRPWSERPRQGSSS